MTTAERAVTVFGATGTVGQHAVRELLERGARVRALVRGAHRLPASVEVIAGDLLERGAVEEALQGAARAVFVAPHADHEERMTENVLQACAAAGARLTYFSVGLPGERLWVRRLWRWMMAPLFPHYLPRFALVDRVLAHPSRPLIVGSVSFCQVTEPFLDDILAGRYTEPAGTLGMVRVDARDIGAALAALTLGEPEGRVFAVEGRDAVNGPKAAALWSEALGRPVTYESHRTGRWRETLARQLSGRKLDDYVKTLRTMPFTMVPVSKARLKKTEALLGRPARGYADYVRDRVAELRAEGRLGAGGDQRPPARRAS